MALRLNGVRDKKTLAERIEESLTMAALWEEVKDRLNTSAMPYGSEFLEITFDFVSHSPPSH